MTPARSADSRAPLDARVALVTGGAQGIGAGICEGLADAGAAVAIVDVQVEKGRQLAQHLTSSGFRAAFIRADIATVDGCQSAVARTVSTFERLDILINNAAPHRDRSMIGKVGGADWAVHEQVVLQAVVNLTDAALPHLAAHKRGAVVNISSVVGSAVALDQCSWPYHVSKAGLNHLTRWLAVRLGPHGVRVNALAPGLIDRDAGHRLTDDSATRAVVESVVPLGRAGRAADVARAAIFLSSEESAYITGQVLVIDGGLGLGEVFGVSQRAQALSGHDPTLEPNGASS